jgi:hypothetical protein
VWAGPGAVGSRWTAPVLAATHLLTLGFMAHAMLGALLQLLPVALVLSGAQLGVSLTRAALFARSYPVRSQPLPAGSGRATWQSIA